MADSDPVIPGLCSFLLGILYEFNREPGEITRYACSDLFRCYRQRSLACFRSTIYPILNRLGVDLLVGRITHLRDDDKFKTVGPDTLVLPYPNQAAALAPNDADKEAEIWFDWAFVDFWKSNYCMRPSHVSVRRLMLRQIPYNEAFLQIPMPCPLLPVSVRLEGTLSRQLISALPVFRPER